MCPNLPVNPAFKKKKKLEGSKPGEQHFWHDADHSLRELFDWEVIGLMRFHCSIM